MSVEIPNLGVLPLLMLWGRLHVCDLQRKKTEVPVDAERGLPAGRWEFPGQGFRQKRNQRRVVCQCHLSGAAFPEAEPHPCETEPLPAILLCDVQESFHLSELLN